MSPKTTTDLKPWFEPGFDEAIKAIVEKYWPQNATLTCHDEAHRWARMLLDMDPDCKVALSDGMFQVGGNHRKSVGHTWLEVDGFIFDPTAAQFDGAIERKYYAEHGFCDGHDLVQRLVWWYNPENPAPGAVGMFEPADDSPSFNR